MAGETSRRSTAMQFFMEEDLRVEKGSTYDRVVDLLNKASLMERDVEKVKNLKMVKELIVHKEPNLLDNFLDEMLAYQNDRSQEARKFVITFIEDACKTDPEVLPKVIGNLTMMLQDDSVQVAKKVILCMGQLYKIAFKWIAKSKTIRDDMKQMWNYIQQLRVKIAEMLEIDNEGVRFHTVKFIECVTITLSYRTMDTELPKNTKEGDDISLDLVPEGHPLLKIRKMADDGNNHFKSLLTFMASPEITSTNLMTVMSSVTQIAKMRPGFIGQVLQGLESLHVNLPPTLTTSQVSSVRKTLKLCLLALLRNPASMDQQTNITTLLTDLGATQGEVLKSLPKDDVIKKRKAQSQPDMDPVFKKPRTLPEPAPLHDDDDDYMTTPYTGMGVWKKPAPVAKPAVMTAEKRKQSAIDITADDLMPRLTPQNVADLVLLSMVMLPDQMPAQFQATYTPIAAAGTDGQIKHIARLLATQLTAASLGKGVAQMELEAKEQAVQDEEDEEASGKHSIETLVGGSVSSAKDAIADMMPPPTSIPTRRPGVPIKAFKLEAISRPLLEVEKEAQSIDAFRRILKLEKPSLLGLHMKARNKILSSLATQFGGVMRTELHEYILGDVRAHEDLAMTWLYQEYAVGQGYNLTGMQAGPLQDKLSLNSFDSLLTLLLTGVMQRSEHNPGLFGRIMTGLPTLTTNALQILKTVCQDEKLLNQGMTTLLDLVIARKTMQLELLDILLDFTSHDVPEVRNAAIQCTIVLHGRQDLMDPIQRYALYYLKLLLQDMPPGELFGPGKVRQDEDRCLWSEGTIKMCLYLYLGLLPVNHTLIHELALVYTSTAPEVKRAILRLLEFPVKGMGMHSPELLKLVENCPKGAETLITRIIHILTDKAAPSPELVDRIRDLYHRRVSDVRFLIPVLAGLSASEVVSALPKLIKLNQVVVKEVFNRLLGLSSSDLDQSVHRLSPLTPAELLVALHNIDNSDCDMKTIIKATNMCFAEKSVYTQEVLALVMQQLMEQTQLPTLLMRTVLQSLAMYPKLIGLVLNILQRLTVKQVWKQKKVWEGFVKCCQRTRPHCFAVLLQLPAPQLKNAFEIAPDLREPLYQHILTFTPHQRAHISKAVMQVLEKDPTQDSSKSSQGHTIKQVEKLQLRIESDKVDKVKELVSHPSAEADYLLDDFQDDLLS